MTKSTDIAIIGAGITGLTLAHYLNKANKGFIVLEKTERPGGVINTINENGFVYETGPNSGVVGQPEVVQLFDELGDAITVEEGNELVKKRYILKNKQWHALPHNHKLAITTPLFTLRDKFRILGEPFRKKGTNPDENLADLVKRRLGNSFLNYAIDPFILGVYAGDPSQLVPRYALPKLYLLEQEYGSFIKGAIKKRKLPKTELEKRTNRSVFSIEEGLNKLCDAVYKSSGQNHYQFNATNISISPTQDQKFHIEYSYNGKTEIIIANQVISTIGSPGLPKLLPFIKQDWMAKLTNLKYARVIEAVIGFKKWEGRPLDGFGILIPHLEKSNLLGILFMSSLFKNRAPEGGALLTVFMGGIRNEQLCDLTDDEIHAILSKEFKSLTGLKEFNPDLIKYTRYSNAIPQYTASTGERLEAIEYCEHEYTGLHIAGNLRDGIGMADRIKQATQLANTIINSHA